MSFEPYFNFIIDFKQHRSFDLNLQLMHLVVQIIQYSDSIIVAILLTLSQN